MIMEKGPLARFIIFFFCFSTGRKRGSNILDIGGCHRDRSCDLPENIAEKSNKIAIQWRSEAQIH